MAFNSVLTKRKKQAREITIKTARNLHFRTKKIAKMDDLRVLAKKQIKVVQLNYILCFIFNFVLRIIYIATFLKFCGIVAHWAFKF